MVVLSFSFFFLLPLIRDCMGPGGLLEWDGEPALDTTAAFDGELGGLTCTFFSLKPFACERPLERL